MAISLPQPLPRGDETILLVEPEPETRKLAAFMLAKQGYHVIEARSASDAVRIFEERDARVDLLLTEAVMTRVNGHDLARTLEVRSPGLKTLFLADCDYERLTRKVAELRGVFFLVRPFTMAILAAKVRERLDAPAKAMTAGMRA
jgi:two-component system, cell cycle sensor histidine kinase and response regulator CckA